MTDQTNKTTSYNESKLNWSKTIVRNRPWRDQQRLKGSKPIATKSINKESAGQTVKREQNKIKRHSTVDPTRSASDDNDRPPRNGTTIMRYSIN